MLDSLSLLRFEHVSWLTIAMLDICTEAQPTLNNAGRIIYHAFYRFLFSIFPSESSLFINSGYENIPIKVGITNRVPKINQGCLFPQEVWILSLETPTIGVVRPSAICPESRQRPVTVGSSLTTLFKYQVK